MFSRNVQFAPGGRNNRRRPRRSVREASDDRGFNGSGWPDFTRENGDISALPSRSCFPTDTFDHRCIRRRCPESLPLPRNRSHKYVKRSGWALDRSACSWHLRTMRALAGSLLFRRSSSCTRLHSSSLEEICHVWIPLRKGTRNSSNLSQSLPARREVFAAWTDGRGLA